MTLTYWYPHDSLRSIATDIYGKGTTLAGIARKIGCSTKFLTRAMKGIASLSPKPIENLIKMYNVNPEYFYLGRGPMYMEEATVEPAMFERIASVEGFTITEKEVQSIQQELSSLQSYGFSIERILAGDENDCTKGISIARALYDMADSIKAIDEDIQTVKARGIVKPVEDTSEPVYARGMIRGAMNPENQKKLDDLWAKMKKGIYTNPLELTTDEFDKQFYNDKNRLLKE
jgi:hypothetical protein